jgi:hypothetical protein
MQNLILTINYTGCSIIGWALHGKYLISRKTKMVKWLNLLFFWGKFNGANVKYEGNFKSILGVLYL